jgi:hypothetical protein
VAHHGIKSIQTSVMFHWLHCPPWARDTHDTHDTHGLQGALFFRVPQQNLSIVRDCSALDKYLHFVHLYAYNNTHHKNFLQYVTFLLPLLLFATLARVVHTIGYCRHQSASRFVPTLPTCLETNGGGWARAAAAIEYPLVYVRKR